MYPHRELGYKSRIRFDQIITGKRYISNCIKDYLIKEVYMYSKARVLDFEKGTTRIGYAVKGRAGRNYRRESYGYCNGNGMFMSYPEPYFCVKLYVYEPFGHVATIDIRDEAINESGRSRLTEKYLEDVCNANNGKKIGVYTQGYGTDKIADINELDLAY